jgi:toxin ParE1/3/4
VQVSEEAHRDVQGIHDLIARDKRGAAAKWVREFHRLAKSLTQNPLQFEVMPEAENVDRPWRHLLFGNYRIVYRVDENRVTILRVIHGSRLLDRSFFGLPPEVEET